MITKTYQVDLRIGEATELFPDNELDVEANYQDVLECLSEMIPVIGGHQIKIETFDAFAHATVYVENIKTEADAELIETELRRTLTEALA